ncbi:Astacin-like metalloendopeptidase [Strongyloides ratti]|uniref:Zinc metalloproteinase n=1 Tax=Strongyloides ratti TaxID=34506 RepID=A0A090LR14_STRRB|nr:Astacin-like metalloendopeptidase [Strongyloides ratti]CEF70616.1 Astacin-like metalloendopeptidase [Strongyloides ratti]
MFFFTPIFIFCDLNPKLELKRCINTKKCDNNYENKNNYCCENEIDIINKKNKSNKIFVKYNNVEEKIFMLKNNTKIFQGDIILNEKQVEDLFYYKSDTINNNFLNNNFLIDFNIRNKRKVMRNKESKWDFPIPYFIGDGVNEHLVEKAIYFLEKDTCVKFEKYDLPKVGVSGIYYLYGKGCKSYIGKQPGTIWQEIIIGEGCNDVGRVQHETLHALGFFHEQSRFDRDRFITILLKNVVEEEKYNFLINTHNESDTLGFAYDYGSIMHYGVYSFSKNKQPTMLPKDILYKKTIGHADKATFSDIKMINLHYCSNLCHNEIKCYNGGYQDPKDCNNCKCVEGYGGPDCSKIVPQEIQCGKFVYRTNDYVESFTVKGAKTCIYHFVAPQNMRVGIKILLSRMYPNKEKECLSLNAAEIKYWNDKSISGARFCLISQNICFISHNHHVMIYYRSNKETNFFSMLYKSVNMSNHNLKQKEIEKRYKKLKKKREK